MPEETIKVPEHYKLVAERIKPMDERQGLTNEFQRS